MWQSKILRAGTMVAFFTIVGKLLGLWRDRILAGQFGASVELDIYYAAFRMAASPRSAPFFTECWQKEGPAPGGAAGNFLNVMSAGVFAISLVAMIFAEPIARLIGPGFEPDSILILAGLIRIMLIRSMIFAVSTILGSILHALQRFLAYSLAPVFYNLGIIAGAIYLAPRWGIYGVGRGVVVGAALHLAVQLPVAWQAGFRFSRAFDLSDGAFRRMIGLMVPRTLALGAYNVGLT